MNTRKYPRTMTEAFGPYAGNKIEEPIEIDLVDVIVVLVSAACVVAVVAFGLVGWLA